MWRRLTSSWWGGSAKKVSVNGSLIVIYGNTPRTLFMSATLEIDKSTTSNYETSIVVTNNDTIDDDNATIEGLENSIPNTNHADQKIEFVLDEVLQLARVANTSSNVLAYSWRSDNKLYCFVFKTSNNEEAEKEFTDVASECIFEHNYDKTPDLKDEGDIAELALTIGTISIPFDLITLNPLQSGAQVKQVKQAPPKQPQPQPATKPQQPQPPQPKPVTQQPRAQSLSATQNFQTPPPKPKKGFSTPDSVFNQEPVKTPPKRPSLYPATPTPKDLHVNDYEIVDENEICRAGKCDLFYYNPETGVFECKQQSVDVVITSMSDTQSVKDFSYILYVQGKDGDKLLASEIESGMSAQFFPEHHSVIWNILIPLSTWSVIFHDQKEETEFSKTLNQCLYEASTQLDFDKLKIEDRDFIVRSTQVENNKVDEYEEDEDFVDFINKGGFIESDEEEEEEESEEEEEETEEEEEEPRRITRGANQKSTPLGKKAKDKNSLLVDSYRHGRTFVVRGSNIGIFNRNSDTTPVYVNMIENVSTLKGDKFTPAKVMLHRQDDDLLMIHPDQDDHKGKVFRMDLNRGKVVEEWSGYQDMVSINELAPIEKYANQTPTPVFGALNRVSIFAVDPRVSSDDKIVGDINKLSSKSNPGYTCMTTTSNGGVAVGSEKGEIRLYSGIPGLPKSTGKGENPFRAKTLLPGFGDHIKGIDVTADGHFVVATCKTYLLIVKTDMPDDSSTGFATPMGKNKPSPKRLQLLPEDLRKTGLVDFRAARFNTGCDGEVWIVTSTGRFLITWNFRRVQQGHLYDYIMKEESEKIVENQFANVRADQPGRDAPIIVATPSDVLLEKKVHVSKNPYKAKKFEWKKK
jgi:hypothetical protein